MFNIIKHADEDFKAKSDLDKIKQGVSLLKEKGYAREELYNDIKASIDKYGPYFVFDNGVAVAHAAPSENCLINGVSLISSKEGFNLYEKNIKLLFTLCVPEGGDHMKLLQSVISAVRDEAMMKEILEMEEK